MVCGGGGGQGGHNLPLPVPRSPASYFFCPFVSWLPSFIVILQLSFKSRCLTPYSERECFGQLASLSKIKNYVVNWATLHPPTWSLKWHSFDTSLHHTAKPSVFCELQSYGSSSQPHQENTGLALSFLRRILTAKETDEILTRLTQCTCVMLSHSHPTREATWKCFQF